MARTRRGNLTGRAGATELRDTRQALEAQGVEMRDDAPTLQDLAWQIRKLSSLGHLDNWRTQTIDWAKMSYQTMIGLYQEELERLKREGYHGTD